MLFNRIPRGVLATLAAVTALPILGACGESDNSSSSSAPGNGTDSAFVAEMIPHHRSAVEMAKTAQASAQHAEIKKLAGNIIAAQNAEITKLDAIGKQLDDAGVKPGSLNMKMTDMGMDMTSDMLKDAKVFDREFIDMMISHHQGAIRMARVELDKGQNAELHTIANAIVDGQAKEIDQMNAWRVDWYGRMSPSGGVPAESDQGGGHDMSDMDMG